MFITLLQAAEAVAVEETLCGLLMAAALAEAVEAVAVGEFLEH